MDRIEIKGRPIAWKRVGANKGRFYDRQDKDRRAFQWKLKTRFTKHPSDAPIALSCTFDSFSFAVLIT